MLPSDWVVVDASVPASSDVASASRFLPVAWHAAAVEPTSPAPSPTDASSDAHSAFSLAEVEIPVRQLLSPLFPYTP